MSRLKRPVGPDMGTIYMRCAITIKYVAGGDGIGGGEMDVIFGITVDETS